MAIALRSQTGVNMPARGSRDLRDLKMFGFVIFFSPQRRRRIRRGDHRWIALVVPRRTVVSGPASSPGIDRSQAESARDTDFFLRIGGDRDGAPTTAGQLPSVRIER